MRNGIRGILLAISFMLNYIAYSQNNIGVSNFRLLETDLTANTSGTTEKDQNGEPAALIKVVTTQTGFTFDGGALGIVKTKQTPGEVWVYIPRGAKKITIKHPQLGVLRDYFFPCSIESGRTYEMTLETGTVQTIVTQKANSQYVVFMVTPADALVELDNEVLPISDGVAQKFVKLGTYDYRIQAKDYHTSAGKVTIDDVKNKKIVNVELEPAFGWIEIDKTEDLEGAQVFIDNALAGTAPMKSQNLSSGQHNVRIVKELYHPFLQIVDVRDNETTTITPTLTSDYATITLNVDNDADIYVNQEKKGSGSWTGRLGTGSYVFEAKKEGHRSTMMNRDISANQGKLRLQLDAPTPIYGSINITSEPSMADVFIDGKEVGQTPLFLSEYLVGEHSVEIRKSGYEGYGDSMKVVEGQTIKIATSLKKYGISDISDNENELKTSNMEPLLMNNEKNSSKRVSWKNVEIIYYNTSSTYVATLPSPPPNIRGMQYVGEAHSFYYDHFDGKMERSKDKCVKQIKKKAAKSKATKVWIFAEYRTVIIDMPEYDVYFWQYAMSGRMYK